MRLSFVAPSALVAFLLAGAGCGASGPAHGRLRVEVDATLIAEARAQARAEAEAQAEAEAEVRVETPGEVRVETPEEARGEADVDVDVDVDVEVDVDVDVEVPSRPVPLEGSDFVEFFGIPLDGAQDVVFVLDRSGSMTEPARARLAYLGEPGSGDADGPEADADARVHDDPDADEPVVANPDEAAPNADDDTAGSASDQTREPRAAPTPRKIDVAHAELIDALIGLPEGTRINVIFFNNRLEAAASGLVPLEDSGRDSLVRFVAETRPSGRTALAPAMRAAYLMRARRIVLLSDGLGNIGGDADAVLRDAREAMRGGVRIDTIGLGTNQDTELLQSLARESGGLYQAL